MILHVDMDIEHTKSSIVNSQRSIVNAKSSIGTLGEKTLHAFLKQHFEPDVKKHEITVGSYVADIVTDSGIIEIQTRSFDKLRKKLSEFLEISPVTVVYPLPRTKWLLWIDEQTGEVSKSRKSPKQGRIYDAVLELYRIKPLLSHHNLCLCIVLIDIEEYRYLNGWSENKKRGSTRCNRVPVDISEVMYLKSTADYLRFIPEDLPSQFTTKDYRDAANINLRTAQTAMNILHFIGTVNRVGKQGNLHIYERS